MRPYSKDRVSDADAAAGAVTVLTVVGAGRGPVVRASLCAADRCGRILRVFAVEKNPNAVVTLQSMVRPGASSTTAVRSNGPITH